MAKLSEQLKQAELEKKTLQDEVQSHTQHTHTNTRVLDVGGTKTCCYVAQREEGSTCGRPGPSQGRCQVQRGAAVENKT